MTGTQLKQMFAFDYEVHSFARSLVIHIHAIVTDPPYGVKEYDAEQLEKRSNGHGGIWRIPPCLDLPVGFHFVHPAFRDSGSNCSSTRL